MLEVQDSAPAEIQSTNIMSHDEYDAAVKQFRNSSWLRYFFPIMPIERKRVSYMVIMFILISFSYTFLRQFKDRVVYSVLDNVESKNWLKIFTFVVTQIFVILAQNISSKSNFNTAFKNLTILFGTLLVINGFGMYFSKAIQPHELFADNLFVCSSLSVRGLSFFLPFVLILNQYVYSIFYILAEVIGSMMVSFVFMTYVNNNTTENQNKRFVKTLYFFSNLSGPASGFIYDYWNKGSKKLARAEMDRYFLIFPICCALTYVVVLGIKSFLEVELQNQIVVSTVAAKKAGSKKAKIGFKDSLYLMFNSKLLLCMSGLALFYNISSNLFDSSNSAGMAASAKYREEDKSRYSATFKSADTILNGLSTAIIILSPLSLLIDTHGIFAFACAPLLIVLISTFITFFFSTVNYRLVSGSEGLFPYSFGLTEVYPYAESVFGTAIQICLKVSKYAFFDIVKEAVAMKIDPMNRPIFKGVFDGSMSKFGKCAGAFYGILMNIAFEAQDNRYYFPITAAVLLTFCSCWFFAIKYLSKSFDKACAAGTYMDPDKAEE